MQEPQETQNGVAELAEVSQQEVLLNMEAEEEVLEESTGEPEPQGVLQTLIQTGMGGRRVLQTEGLAGMEETCRAEAAEAQTIPPMREGQREETEESEEEGEPAGHPRMMEAEEREETEAKVSV